MLKTEDGEHNRVNRQKHSLQTTISLHFVQLILILAFSLSIFSVLLLFQCASIPLEISDDYDDWNGRPIPSLVGLYFGHSAR